MQRVSGLFQNAKEAVVSNSQEISNAGNIAKLRLGGAVTCFEYRYMYGYFDGYSKCQTIMMLSEDVVKDLAVSSLGSRDVDKYAETLTFTWRIYRHGFPYSPSILALLAINV